MWVLLDRFLREDDGATSIEYALLGAMFAVASIAAANALGAAMSEKFNSIDTAVTSATAS